MFVTLNNAFKKGTHTEPDAPESGLHLRGHSHHHAPTTNVHIDSKHDQAGGVHAHGHHVITKEEHAVHNHTPTGHESDGEHPRGHIAVEHHKDKHEVLHEDKDSKHHGHKHN